MTTICKRRTAVGLLCIGLACLTAAPLPAQEEDVDDAVIQMIVELLGEADRDMRALALQQIREEVPGEAATKKFAELLPTLSAEGQAGLLEALGDRGDAAARPAVMEGLNHGEEAVRAAAMRALGALGGEADVTLLASNAAAGSPLEKNAARQSLIRLRGDQINAAIVAAVKEADPNVRAELLAVLAARNAKETVPTVLESVEDPDPAVRLAALGALRFLADENHVAQLVEILEASQDQQQRRKAELTLLVVCSRGGQECAPAIIDRLGEADVPSQIVLLRALARAGGADALQAVVARQKDEDEAVRDEAVRMLSMWSDPAVGDHLLEIARTSESLRHHVLAIRGLARLADPEQLAAAMSLAKRAAEKRLILGTLGGIATPQSLALVIAALEDAELSEEAGLAAVRIAEKIEDGDQDAIRSAMEKVLKATKNQQIQKKAQEVLQSQ